MAALARIPKLIARRDGVAPDDGFGHRILCIIQLDFSDGTSISLERLYMPGIGAFTMDPSTPPDAAIYGPVHGFPHGLPLASQLTDAAVQPHNVWGFAHAAVDNLHSLPANIKAWLFPEKLSNTIPISWARLPSSPSDPVNVSLTMPTPSSTAGGVAGTAGPSDLEHRSPILDKGKGKAVSPAGMLSSPAASSRQEDDGGVIATPINLQLMYTTMLNTLRLHSLHTVPDISVLYALGNTSDILPNGIDLTTVEILTFFPGLLHDPYFVYRAYSTGWNMHTMIHVARHHRNIHWNLTGREVMPLLRRGMAYVLGVSEAAWSEDKYSKQVPVPARTKLVDYTSTGLSVVSSTQYANKRNLRLSELRQGLTILPQGTDAGDLTRLVDAQLRGQIPDLTMSAVVAHIAAEADEETGAPHQLHHHRSVDDNACFWVWRSVAIQVPQNTYD